MNILYKALPEDKSPHGHKFRLNEWYKVDDIKICELGFHASENIIYAIGYVNADWVAKVEVRGKSIKEKNKQCWSEMRIIKWKKWTKKDSIALAIYAAELVIDIYEKKYPDDNRPRKAIDAAKKVLKRDTAKNRAAASAAAWDIGDASDTVWYAAWTAASDDRHASRAAALAASAAATAGAAAYKEDTSLTTDDILDAGNEIIQKCHDFVIKRKGL